MRVERVYSLMVINKYNQWNRDGASSGKLDKAGEQGRPKFCLEVAKVGALLLRMWTSHDASSAHALMNEVEGMLLQKLESEAVAQQDALCTCRGVLPDGLQEFSPEG